MHIQEASFFTLKTPICSLLGESGSIATQEWAFYDGKEGHTNWKLQRKGLTLVHKRASWLK